MKKPNVTSAFFEVYAVNFDAIYGTKDTLLNRWVNRWLRKSMWLRYEKTLAGCQPVEGRRVIDIGCGPGYYGIALARQGAAQVLGLDFADGMLALAADHAAKAGVAERCTWVHGDFSTYPVERGFDYAICMGLMDYIAEPGPFIAKVLSVTTGKAFFSFPLAGGFLGWQRKLRYRRRCPLFLYTVAQVEDLFRGRACKRFTVERIARDLFVTAWMEE